MNKEVLKLMKYYDYQEIMMLRYAYLFDKRLDVLEDNRSSVKRQVCMDAWFDSWATNNPIR
jgi:hypothetical protein